MLVLIKFRQCWCQGTGKALHHQQKAATGFLCVVQRLPKNRHFQNSCTTFRTGGSFITIFWDEQWVCIMSCWSLPLKKLTKTTAVYTPWHYFPLRLTFQKDFHKNMTISFKTINWTLDTIFKQGSVFVFGVMNAAYSHFRFAGSVVSCVSLL